MTRDREQLARVVLEALSARLDALHTLGSGALRQLDDAAVHRRPRPGLNSPAVLVKHVRGNTRSRFTDFLTTDGEKPWRDRDAEFEDDDATTVEVQRRWDDAIATVRATLGDLDADALMQSVGIRGEPHSVPQALFRALDHLGYHTGQLVWAAKLIVGPERWRTLTVPPGGSAAYNASRGFDPSQPQRGVDADR